ncbi:hypothetical protein F7725_001200 [Dissostichus mawsoni]|uniref:ER membrane protein complex subunit 3 n=1 Tax=Dissostichus mawsoni TaxID=36200 RepID=A0A7J5ZGL7_DISMA|nr:hypothetical protein F7725_001200 [Dissostichus mawsoni]
MSNPLFPVEPEVLRRVLKLSNSVSLSFYGRLVEQRAMAGPELLLDSSIRMWVVLPIVFITFFVGIIRHYVTQLLHSDKKVDLEQVSDSQVLLRSRVLRENGKYIPKQSFAMRKHYFNDAETGFFKKVKRKVVPKNPMTGGNLTNVLPMIVIGGWINWAFSGFVISAVPLTLRFKPMLQRGIDLLSLDASWVSSASWYFLNVFAADQSRIMQDQMTGAAMAMPPDPNKAFKSEWEALEIVEHKWALENVEDELMTRDLNFGTLFTQDIKSTMF